MIPLELSEVERLCSGDLDMAPDAPAKLRGAPTAVRVPEGVALKIPK